MTQLYAAREMFTRSHNRYGHKAEAAAHPDQIFFWYMSTIKHTATGDVHTHVTDWKPAFPFVTHAQLDKARSFLVKPS